MHYGTIRRAAITQIGLLGPKELHPHCLVSFGVGAPVPARSMLLVLGIKVSAVLVVDQTIL